MDKGSALHKFILFLDSIILVKEGVSEAERLFNNSADFYTVNSTEVFIVFADGLHRN